MILQFLEINQPIGTFYIVSIPASALFKMVTVRRHDIEGFDGVQRELSKKRVTEISNFCHETDAVFPTSIVISVDKGIPYSIDKTSNTIFIPDDTIIGDVIDGQHRLWGIKESGIQTNFDLPVVLMFDLEIAEKAYVFSIINSTQTKVNKSLIYNLFGLSPDRSPYKTCHEIARVLNGKTNSPFCGRMKMLGKKEPDQPNASLSQGTFVKQLLVLISKNPEEDTRSIKSNSKLLDDNSLPLRQFFVSNHDEIILKILENCFQALRRVFYEEWLVPDKNILWKTTGFCGVMMALNTILRKGMAENELTESFFVNIFTSFKDSLQLTAISLTSKDFPGGGGQNQKRLAKLIIDSISSSESKNTVVNGSLPIFIKTIDSIANDMSIHEKYELYRIINGDREHIYFFSVKKLDKDFISIYYPYCDSTIIVQGIEKEEYKKILEDRWFNGLDAETWYGYQQSLDKDD